MRCMCQNCGEYMVHDEKGIFSHCVFPNCLKTCAACLGTQQGPLSPEGLRDLLAQRERADAEREQLPEENENHHYIGEREI